MTLNETERRLATFVAKSRIAVNRRLGIVRPLESRAEDEAVQINAVGGEIAFCRMFNLYPESIAVVEPPYPDADCFSHALEGIDVKTTDHINPEYVYVHRSASRKHVDIYAFMKGRFPDYDLVGIIRAEEAIVDENLCDVGHGPCYRIRTSDLIGVLIGNTPSQLDPLSSRG